MEFFANRVVEESGIDMGEASVIYIETRNILDQMGRQIGSPVSQELKKMLLRKRNLNKEEISYEQYHETERNLKEIEKIFKEVIQGRLFSEAGLLKYKEDVIDEPVYVKNAASGMKIFLLLYQLIENGSLKENSWILIDEPESNLHPDWHLKLAEILILLKTQMNVHILLSSHSPYFMRALEVKMADYGIKGNGRFYLMEEINGMCTAKNVTECTEEIYKQLYRPLEAL